MDWPTYNEALVKRGIILLDPGLLSRLMAYLESSSEKAYSTYRSQEPAKFRANQPPPNIYWVGTFFISSTRWRALIVPDYSTTCRRVNRLSVTLDPHIDADRSVTIAVDASDIKVADRGEWVRTKWKRRQGFLKIHIAMDVETKQIVALEVTD